jgi:cystathionine beta-lyase family protein involved in aluminum resistance
MKELILKLNKKEIETIKDALDTQKVVVKIKASNGNQQRRELAINELYNIESVENKIKEAK